MASVLLFLPLKFKLSLQYVNKCYIIKQHPYMNKTTDITLRYSHEMCVLQSHTCDCVAEQNCS